MLDVSEAINDPDLIQTWTALRSSGGTWGPGGWSEGSTTLTMSGIVSVAKEKDLLMIPEGDRVQGAMVFHSTQEIYITDAGTTQRTSDLLVWHGHTYRVVSVADYSDYGYYRAIAVRTQGA